MTEMGLALTGPLLPSRWKEAWARFVAPFDQIGQQAITGRFADSKRSAVLREADHSPLLRTSVSFTVV